MNAVSIAEIQAAGIVGAGGAGFPTHIKLSGKADTVVLNAAECEPLLHKDKELLRCCGQAVIDGLAQAIRLTGATRGVIGIKGKYKDVIDQVAPLLGSNMAISPLSDAYPVGDEMVLVYDTLGRVVPPGGIPLQVGAVVMNVETAMNVASAAKGPVVEKYVAVAGAVANPMTLRVPVGIPLAELVQAAGGPTIKDVSYLIGGVMMGYLQDDLKNPVDKTTGAIIALPSTHNLILRRRRDYKTIARIGRAACDQCSFCTELCPRYLLGHPIEPHRAMRSLGFNSLPESNVMGSAFCCECNLCSLYSCPEDLDPKNVSADNKRRLAAEGKKWTNAPYNQGRPQMLMAGRKAPMGRLMAKLGLRNYKNAGPLRAELLMTRRVGIKLKQHVGATCEPVVKVAQTVTCGQLVGQVPVKDGKAALGSPVHASIAGKVTAIQNGIVWIEKE